MVFSELRKLLLDLKKSIAAKTETNKLLYQVDHIQSLIPNTDCLNDKIHTLKVDCTQLKRKIKEIEKQKSCVDEDLQLAKMELKVRMNKNQKLQRQIKEMRYQEARKKKKYRKEQERKRKQISKQEFILNELSSLYEKIDADITQDYQSIGRKENRKQIYTYTAKINFNDSQSDISTKYFSGDNTYVDQSLQENLQLECCFEQYSKVGATIELAVNKVQPKYEILLDQ